MEAIVERDNLTKALARVQRNEGAPGIDGMSVEALALHLKDHWPTIRASCSKASTNRGRCGASRFPRRRGGMRPLGVPPPPANRTLIQSAFGIG